MDVIVTLWGCPGKIDSIHTDIHLFQLQSIASSNFSLRIFFSIALWRGIKCDSALVASPGPLLKCLTDLDGRAVEVKGDSRISVARVLN